MLRTISNNHKTHTRYLFQAQEMDDEIKGDGNSVNYKYRMHDPRLGRFFATDPLKKKYPYLTPYQFSSNQPIHAPELEGCESARELGFAVANPIDAQYVRVNKNLAFQWSNWTNLPGRTDGRRDAYRHALWNALNAIDIGRAQAKVVGDLHESSNDPNTDPKAVEMDLFNNKVGRQIASDYFNEVGGQNNLPETGEMIKEISTKIKQAIENGEMKIIKMDTEENYLDEKNKRIDTSVEGWENKKVLVPSNTKPVDAKISEKAGTNNGKLENEYNQTEYNNESMY